jgi:hypothetical protein
MAGHLYDELGDGYTATRRTDPRIAAQLWGALGDAERIVNVGAGTGSYEPTGRSVVAVEPSRTMRAQRPAGAAQCVGGAAEELPFADATFDAAMAILTDWYWPRRASGFAEMRRVARSRLVVLTVDRSVAETFWLSAEYLPRAHELWGTFDQTLRDLGDCEIVNVPIPADCLDGFFHAFWRRPAAYLLEPVRRTMAVFRSLHPDESSSGIARLSEDLDTGRWAARHVDLLELDTLDLGYRLLIQQLSTE